MERSRTRAPGEKRFHHAVDILGGSELRHECDGGLDPDLQLVERVSETVELGVDVGRGVVDPEGDVLADREEFEVP